MNRFGDDADGHTKGGPMHANAMLLLERVSARMCNAAQRASRCNE